MRINLYLLLFLLLFSGAQAQKGLRLKADAYIPVVVRLFNQGAYDSLYQLGGMHFQKIWPTAERFRDIFHGLHAGFGDIAAYKFDTIIKNTVYYKADFKKETMNLGLEVNPEGKLVDISVSSNVQAPPELQAIDTIHNNASRREKNIKQ